MIKRIVDSVSLMIDDQSHMCGKTSVFTPSENICPNDDSAESVIDDIPPGVLVDLLPPSRTEMYPFTNPHVYEDFFPPSQQTTNLLTQTSSYISPYKATSIKNPPCSPSSSSSSSSYSRRPIHSVRRQSPSPGPPVRDRRLPNKLYQQLACPKQLSTLPTSKIEIYENPPPLPICQSSGSTQILEHPSNDLRENLLDDDDSDGAPDDYIGVGGTSSQADPLVMQMECLIIPFVRDLTQVELRIPVRQLTKLHRRIIKALAAEHELVVLSSTKPGSGSTNHSVIIVRKRASLLLRQAEEAERRHADALERARKKAALEEEQRMYNMVLEAQHQTNGIQRSTCSQTVDKQQPPLTGRKAYRRLRNERRKLARENRLKQQQQQSVKKPKLVETGMQTVPEDWWLCPWCWQHIPPMNQCGHEVVCRAGFQQKKKALELKNRLAMRNAVAEARRKQKLGLKVANNQKKNPLDPLGTLSGRSRSRTRLAMRDKKVLERSLSKTRRRSSSRTDVNRENFAVTKLDQLHPNDIEAMVRLMQRLCTETNCKRVATADRIKCAGCHRIYCDHHRPLGMHAACQPEPYVGDDESNVLNICSSSRSTTAGIACGMDWDEKRNLLKSAIRQRRTVLSERRQRC